MSLIVLDAESEARLMKAGHDLYLDHLRVVKEVEERLAKNYKHYRRKCLTNNWLKMHNEPMKRRNRK